MEEIPFSIIEGSDHKLPSISNNDKTLDRVTMQLQENNFNVQTLDLANSTDILANTNMEVREKIRSGMFMTSFCISCQYIVNKMYISYV